MEDEQVCQENLEEDLTKSEDIKLNLNKGDCSALELDSCSRPENCSLNKNQAGSKKIESGFYLLEESDEVVEKTKEKISQRKLQDNLTEDQDILLDINKGDCNKLELDFKSQTDSNSESFCLLEKSNEVIDTFDDDKLLLHSSSVNKTDPANKYIQNTNDLETVLYPVSEDTDEVCNDLLTLERNAADIANMRKENFKNNIAVKTQDYRLNLKDDDFDPLSEGCIVVKRDNTSLCNLLLYSSAESSSSSSSSTDTESSSEEAINKNEVICIESTKPVAVKPKKHETLQNTLKRLGELSIDDLPPVPDLSKVAVNVGPHECAQMGVISSIIEKLVMVESIPNHPAYDIDTMLFLNEGKDILGLVHDVIGPVSCPIYVIRFNSAEDIKKQNICKGLPVFSAPKSEHTQYVFLPHLLAAKGSDASWQNDKEVPAEFVDFSDDEAERLFRNNLSGNNRKRRSHDRHRNFEKNMNIKNLLDSKIHSLKDKSMSSIPKPSTCTTYKTSQLNQNFRPVFAPQPGVLNVPLMQMWPQVGVNVPRLTRPPFSNVSPYNRPPVPFFCPTVPPPPIHAPSRSEMIPNLPNPPPPPPPGVDMPSNDTTAAVYPPNLGLPGPQNFPVPRPPTVPNMSIYPMPNPRMFYYNYSVPVTNSSGNNLPSRPERPSHFPSK